MKITAKSFGTSFSIKKLKGTRRERIGCFYGRLTAVVILTMICGAASRYIYDCLKREASFHKVINRLKRKVRLSEAFRSGTLKELIEELPNISKNLCKQKRKRKTTRQLLENAVPFPENFPCDDTENYDDNNSVLLTK